MKDRKQVGAKTFTRFQTWAAGGDCEGHSEMEDIGENHNGMEELRMKRSL